MSETHTVHDFEEYLNIVKNEIDKTKCYYRGQGKRVVDGYHLWSSIARYEYLKSIVFDKQLFPDLDGMAKWLKFHEFECQNGDTI